jgi:hypothetical protein
MAVIRSRVGRREGNGLACAAGGETAGQAVTRQRSLEGQRQIRGAAHARAHFTERCSQLASAAATAFP